MFPNVRLLIAAMLASVVVLICGFAMFAAFRVSHEPIAHLPVAVAPLQLVADNRVTLSTVLVSRQTVEQPSAFEMPVGVPDETPAGTAAEHDHAKLVPESEQSTSEQPASEQTAAPQPVATTDAAASAAPEPENAVAAMTPAEQPPTPATPVSELPASPQQGGDRSPDIEADAASAPSPLRPPQPATPTGETATEATSGAAMAFADETPSGEAAADGQTAVAEAPPKAVAAPDPEAKPAAVAGLAVEATPDDALDRSEADTLPEPPLPRARPNVSDAQHISHAQRAGDAPAARAADERARSAAAIRPRRARVVARTVRAVRFASPYYYAQAQYAQSIDQSYYGQSNFQGAQMGQEQIAVRRVVRPRPAAGVAVRKTNSAIGGPFVSARSR